MEREVYEILYILYVNWHLQIMIFNLYRIYLFLNYLDQNLKECDFVVICLLLNDIDVYIF